MYSKTAFDITSISLLMNDLNTYLSTLSRLKYLLIVWLIVQGTADDKVDPQGGRNRIVAN